MGQVPGHRVHELPSAWATGRYSRSIPRRNTHATAGRPQLDPAVFVAARVVPGERGRRAAAIIGQQHARLDEDLEAVADPQDQLARRLERLQALGQMMPDLVGQDAAGRHVVAIAESARQAEDLVRLGQLRDDSSSRLMCISLGPAAGLLEGERGFLVAVRSGSSQDQDTRSWP